MPEPSFHPSDDEVGHCADCGRLVPFVDLDTHRATHDEVSEPDPAGDLPAGAERFTTGLVLDVGKVLVEHGYAALDGRALVELQQHLLHFLHGAERGTDRCYGGTR